MMTFTEWESPIGRLRLERTPQGLSRIAWPDTAEPPPEGALRDAMGFVEAVDQLERYFAGVLRAFDVPLAPAGTPFQRAVWHALCAIPYGQTRSYGDVARAIGRPTASRAVGAANGQNPLPILVPCHRVVGADGRLTGYGGGLDLKRRLLTLEAGPALF